MTSKQFCRSPLSKIVFVFATSLVAVVPAAGDDNVAVEAAAGRAKGVVAVEVELAAVEFGDEAAKVSVGSVVDALDLRVFRHSADPRYAMAQ